MESNIIKKAEIIIEEYKKGIDRQQDLGKIKELNIQNGRLSRKIIISKFIITVLLVLNVLLLIIK